MSLTLGGNSSGGYGIDSPKYNHETGRYESRGVVWVGNGAEPESETERQAGVRKLFSGSLLEGSEIVRNSGGGYTITRGAQQSAPQSVPVEPVTPQSVPVKTVTPEMQETPVQASQLLSNGNAPYSTTGRTSTGGAAPIAATNSDAPATNKTGLLLAAISAGFYFL